MIGWVMTLAGRRAGRIAIAALAVVAMLAAAGWWLHAAAYQRGYVAHRAEAEAATRALNARLARSEQALRVATEAYRRERRQAEDTQRRLADEASEDPDAGRRALGADSVRRIGSIR